MEKGKEVMKFISKNAEVEQVGQGHITICCPKLWEMSNEEFDELFN